MTPNSNTYGHQAMDNNRLHRVPDMALVQTGHGCKIGKQTKAIDQGGPLTAASPLSQALKAQVLDSLAKVKGKSFAAFSIQVFVRNAHLKTDEEIIEMITGLKDQIKDSGGAMERVLGDQYEFIKSLKLG